MYYLKLIKGKTYWGIVRASQKNPNVCVPEKEQADLLVKSGFFVLVNNPDEDVKENTASKNDAENDTEEQEGSYVPGDDESEEDEEQENSIMSELQQKTKAELTEYAEKNGIDLSGCKTKDDSLSKIFEDMARAAAARQAIRDNE